MAKNETSGSGRDGKNAKVEKTAEEWRQQLSEEEFQVARCSATERAFTGRYWDHWENGVYHCIGCGEALFRSVDKFDAGCGWPSYSEEIAPGRIERLVDTSHGMVRVEVRCAKCGSHLGHVFDDGPAPTGERYCINSASIGFDPA